MKPPEEHSLRIINDHLVGGIPTPLKNMNVNWDGDSKYMGT